MQTVHPSIMLGSYVWDEERLPRDEFDIRMQAIQDAIKERDLAGVIVYGDGREHAALAYFSNFIPRMRWAMALFPAKGSPRLLASVSSRDLPAMRTMTWLPDVKSGWEWRWFDEWVATLGPSPRIGVIGYDLATPILIGAMEKSLGEGKLVSMDDVYVAARKCHRPREISVMRDAAGIVARAGKEIAAAYARGESVESAALAGENYARGAAAHDVRTLVSRDGGLSITPYRAKFDDRPTALLAYLAVKFQGYWAETYISAGAPPLLQRAANESLESLLGALRPGARLADVAERCRATSNGRELHAVLSGRYGRRIGISLNEGSEIRPGADGIVQADTVYALQVGFSDQGCGVVSSAIVRTRADVAAEVLLRLEGQ
jgi:Xaa-Pro aminopeptidase